MVQVYSEALQDSISVGRIIKKIEGSQPGPAVVFFSGIHGNEPAGVFAVKEALADIRPDQVEGVIYGICGNLQALDKQRRFLDQDLNRIWTEGHLSDLRQKSERDFEEQEQAVLYDIIKAILAEHEGPYYFFDLHTTSVNTRPFITINDALINRKFSRHFPVSKVLGIEEYLSGPLLSYMNEKGYVSLGFESGQHDKASAITNAVSFVRLCLVYTGAVQADDLGDFDFHFEHLKKVSAYSSEFFEIVDVHRIKHGDSFTMLNGFKNFQVIKKGLPLATYNEQPVVSRFNAQLFMPLYQKQGYEGFFVIRKIKPIILRLSALLRWARADSVLVLLPGLSWLDSRKHALYVNLKITRFLAKSIFHLLGYRSRHTNATHLILFNRERAAKTKMYREEPWYKKPC